MPEKKDYFYARPVSEKAPKNAWENGSVILVWDFLIKDKLRISEGNDAQGKWIKKPFLQEQLAKISVYLGIDHDKKGETVGF